MAVDVILTSIGGLRYNGVRYAKGDRLRISEAFLGRHVTRFEVIEKLKRKRKPKETPVKTVVEVESDVMLGDNA